MVCRGDEASSGDVHGGTSRLHSGILIVLQLTPLGGLFGIFGRQHCLSCSAKRISGAIWLPNKVHFLPVLLWRVGHLRLQFRCTNQIGLPSAADLPCLSRFFASLVFEPCGSDNGGPNNAKGDLNRKSCGFGANGACGAVGTWWPKPDS